MRESNNHTLRDTDNAIHNHAQFSDVSVTQAKYHQITRKNSAYWQINTSGLFSYTRTYSSSRMYSHTAADQHRPCFYTKYSVLAWVKVHLQLCSRRIHLIPKSLFLRQKTKWRVTLEKRTISYLSVPARIRVIDPFSHMRRGYYTILDDADSANRNNFVPSQSLWCSPGNVSQGDQYKRNVNC